MNILLVSEFFYPWPGGAELTNWKIMKGLAEKGHKVSIVTSQIFGTKEYEVLDGLEIYRPFPIFDTKKNNDNSLTKRFIFTTKLYPYLMNFLKSHEIDIICNVEYATAWPAYRAATKNKIPSILCIHSLIGMLWYKNANPVFATLAYFREKIPIALFRFDAISCNSNVVAKHLKFHASKNIYVIPHLFDAPEIIDISKKTDAKSIRDNLGIKSSELFLLCIGALISVKNIENLIRVLSKSQTNYVLVIVGDGPRKNKIEKLTISKNMQQKVKLLGAKTHEETIRILASCDILLLPSQSETFSLAAMEALAIGKPLIATKVGILPELNSNNLYLVDHIEDINNLIQSNITAGNEDFLSSYPSVEKVIGHFENMLLRVIKESTRKSGISPTC
jgi:glycosyltransferase involved in cell wall biosynthesis